MKKVWTWVLIIAVILIAMHIALPFIAENYANKALQNLEGYYGSLEDIDINLFRGAYVIEELVIIDKSNAIEVPFLSIQAIDLSVEWGALFDGAIVGEVILEYPVINFAIAATGYTLGNGELNINAEFDALKEIPDLDLTLNLENVSMTALNEFVRAYTNLDVEQGTFNLYSEVVIDDAQLSGYIRPILENLEILDWDEEKGGFFSKVWEAVAGGIRAIFENPSEDQVATQTPLKGNLNQMNLDAGIWPTIWGLFKNAFVEALSKRTEGAIEFPLKE